MRPYKALQCPIPSQAIRTANKMGIPLVTTSIPTLPGQVVCTLLAQLLFSAFEGSVASVWGEPSAQNQRLGTERLTARKLLYRDPPKKKHTRGLVGWLPFSSPLILNSNQTKAHTQRHMKCRHLALSPCFAPLVALLQDSVQPVVHMLLPSSFPAKNRSGACERMPSRELKAKPAQVNGSLGVLM